MSPLDAKEERILRLERIIEISRSLNSTLSLRPLLYQILNAAQELTNTEACSIMLLDRKTGELHFEAATGTHSQEIRRVVVPMESSVAGWVIQNDQPVIVPDAQNDPRFYSQVDTTIQFETRSIVAVPLAVRGKVIGVLEGVNKWGGEPFSDDDVATLVALADQAAVAIENALLFQQSDLVSEMVHELRTPLTSIASYAEMMRRKAVSAEQRDEFASIITREALRLSRLADDFLELARLESGRAFLAQEAVALGDVVQEALAVLKPQAEGKEITLQAVVVGYLPPITGDATRLKQTLINLLANAIKYCRPGDRVTVTVRTAADEVVVGVVDTGPGIPQEAQERLFTKFYRLPVSEEETEGTGLGLAICRQIVEAHRGRIWVESAEGKGATFYVALPASRTEPAA
jgi:signal transduction histidine kinase